MKSTRRAAAAFGRTDFFQNFLRDLKSLKAFWSHIYLALYAWTAIWTVLHYREAIQTVVTVTGGVVSAVFAGYVFSRRQRTRAEDNVTLPRVEPEEESDA